MIYFVRHGESEANLRGVFAGQRENSVLTEKGKEQAKTTAQAIKLEVPFKIERIISSPLKGALETAEIITRELGLPLDMIEIDNTITEYDMGTLTGTPIHKISSSALTMAKEAENPYIFRDRVFFCFKGLTERRQNVLVVSHAGVGRILEALKQNKDAKLFYDIPAYGNASVTLIDWI